MLREESKSWFTFAAKDLPKHGEERVEFTFDNPAKISDEWIVTCDSTWGEGYSTGLTIFAIFLLAFFMQRTIKVGFRTTCRK